MIDILDLIFKSSQESPKSVAIIEQDQAISYQELLEKSYQVAQCILAQNNNSRWVAIDANGGWRSYALILGSWIAGKGYLPINNLFPTDANERKLNDAKCDFVISYQDIDGLNTISPVDYSCDLLNPIEGTFAYLLHTSGTTGEPKGVPVSWRNLNSFYSHYYNHNSIHFTQFDRVLQSYELTFDVSVFCFLSAFCSGATLVLPENSAVKYQGFFKAIQKHQVSIVSFVPSVVRMSYDFLDRVTFPSVKYSFFSGEALYGNWAERWMNCVVNAEVYNCYGPTETVIVCTEEHLNELGTSYFKKSEPLPLGSCFDGVDLELNSDEIVFSGEQVFNGYLNSELCATYFTGDLAKLDDHGKLIFTGRKDEQIQWNGYRIELLEIDRRLKSKLGVEVKSIHVENLHQLVIFTTGSAQDISDCMKQLFPVYYHPSKIQEVPEMPLNSNGKLDRSALVKLVLM